jgi:uncharacterized membrane protein YukC
VAKIRPIRNRKKPRATKPGGIGCVVVLCLAFTLFMFFLYYVLKHANG